jgi:hypothetical protein
MAATGVISYLTPMYGLESSKHFESRVLSRKDGTR